jgi:hypothetical protein
MRTTPVEERAIGARFAIMNDEATEGRWLPIRQLTANGESHAN